MNLVRPRYKPTYARVPYTMLCRSKGGANIPVAQALDHVWGYAVGLDMTRRDLQMKMREAGRPWELGKAFDQSAPIAPLHRVADEIGRAHVCTPVTNEQLVCRLLLETKNQQKNINLR